MVSRHETLFHHVLHRLGRGADDSCKLLINRDALTRQGINGARINLPDSHSSGEHFRKLVSSHAGTGGNVRKTARPLPDGSGIAEHIEKRLGSSGHLFQTHGTVGGIVPEVIENLPGLFRVSGHLRERDPQILNAGSLRRYIAEKSKCSLNRCDGSTDSGKRSSKLTGKPLYRILGLSDFALDFVERILEGGGIAGKSERNVSHVWSGV